MCFRRDLCGVFRSESVLELHAKLERLGELIWRDVNARVRHHRPQVVHFDVGQRTLQRYAVVKKP